MYIPQIKEKHPLVDLARYGTRSRKNIHPEILIGVHSYPPTYKEGDLLDANAILDLLKNSNDQEKSFENTQNTIKRNKEQVEKALDQIRENETQITDAIDEINNNIKDFVKVSYVEDDELICISHLVNV